MTGRRLHIDFESRSTTDLVKSGVFRYSEDPETNVWGFSYRFDDVGPVGQWRPGYEDPVEVLDHVSNGGCVVAHNAVFERTIWNAVLRGRDKAHWPKMQITQQDCTMARAAAIAHPQGLAQLGDALNTQFKKDAEGHKLMMKMAKPRSFNADGSVVWWDDPADIDRNMQYCDRDVETETCADEMLPPLSDTGRRVWELDQVINERGVHFDKVAVERSAQVVEYSKKQNNKVMRMLTGRGVQKCTSDQQIIKWLNARGVVCTTLKKGEVDNVVFMAELRSDDLAVDVIRLRQAAWKTSTAKYRAVQRCVSLDDRVRGLLNYHAASTGRWGGRLVQPQNFPRVDSDDDVLVQQIVWLHSMLNDMTFSPKDIYEHIVAIYGPLEPMTLLSKALRSMICAAPGNVLIGGDFSNVEGRVSAWLSNETWKINAFTDYDNGTGPDLYKLAYARSFGVDVNTIGKGRERQIGKVQELALGFQGGVGAYMSMGANYGVNPYELSKPVYEATGAEQWNRTLLQYENAENKFKLLPNEWCALKILVDNWRAAHPKTVKCWWELQDAAIEAVSTPGKIVSMCGGKLTYYSDGRVLWLVLPSGRMLSYSSPQIETTKVIRVNKDGEKYVQIKYSVSFYGVCSLTRQWKKHHLYGGHQWENAVQAIACDLMIFGMFNLEDAGYPLVLTVHDEIVAEVFANSNYHNEYHFAEIMSKLPPWAFGLPHAVGAWKDKRYVK